MKKKWILISVVMLGMGYAQIDLNSAIEEMKTSTEQAVNAGHGKNKKGDEKGEVTNGSMEVSHTNAPLTDTPKTNLKVYQNYDFIPGDTILFEDHFTDGEMGEFPTHWKLIQGQAAVNVVDGENVIGFTQPSIVAPLIKKQSYLPNQYTIEFDYWVDNTYNGLNQITLLFDDEMTGWTEGKMHLSTDYQNFTVVFPDGQLNQNIQDKYTDMTYANHWHHLAIAVKGQQMKIYVDQFRILTVPDCNYKAGAIGVSVNGLDNGFIGFKNFRLAYGGGMNMLGKKFTDTKIVTHGILFDINKASIKPESMGVMNQIYQLLKDNADLKFEIGGYTDSDGDDDSNLKLSEKRAQAVKDQLVSMGISADRLTTKGYGETNPMDVNTTLEGKANNRRVEFTKK